MTPTRMTLHEYVAVAAYAREPTAEEHCIEGEGAGCPNRATAAE
jgi:hypothetical protein